MTSLWRIWIVSREDFRADTDNLEIFLEKICRAVNFSWMAVDIIYETINSTETEFGARFFKEGNI